MNKTTFISVIGILALVSCNRTVDSKSEQKNVTLAPQIIDEWGALSDEFTDFEIIPLENKPECMLTSVRKMLVTNAGFYFFDNGPTPQILSFSGNGMFKNAIGRVGHAKDEYQMVMNIASTHKGDTVAIIKYPGINLYSEDGKYLSSLAIKGDKGTEDMLITDEGIYLGNFHRQAKSLMSLYDKKMNHVRDIVEMPCDPTGKPLGAEDIHWIQQDGDYIYCLDALNACFYVYNRRNPDDMTKYSIGLDNMVTEDWLRKVDDVYEKYQISSYQVYNGVIRGTIESNNGHYDFRFRLTENTVALMHHEGFGYSFACNGSGYFYKLVSPDALLDFMDESKRYMDPIRQLLGDALTKLNGKVSYNDNSYIIKMRLKEQ